jgi:hypothetical protein
MPTPQFRVGAKKHCVTKFEKLSKVKRLELCSTTQLRRAAVVAHCRRKLKSLKRGISGKVIKGIRWSLYLEFPPSGVGTLPDGLMYFVIFNFRPPGLVLYLVV